MNDVTIIDQFLNTFAAYIDSGFGLLRGEVAFLTATLIVIDMTIAGLSWAMSHATGQGEDVIAKLLRKVLYVGAFAYIINNFNWLASIVFRSFAGLGITATGSAITMENFLQPGRLAKTGLDAGGPIFLQLDDMMGFPEVFLNLDAILVLFLAWLVVVLCFFVLAIQLFITLIEFKLTTLAGFVLVPFALWNKTSFLAEKVLGNVVASGVKVLVLAVIVGIGSGLFTQFQVHPDEPSLDHALVIMLASLTLLALGIFGPGIATGLVSGAPQLGAGAMAGAAIGAAGTAVAVGAAATGVGGAVAAGARMAPAAAKLAGAGARAATSAAGSAKSAFQAGSAAASGGAKGAMAGLGNVAKTGAQAAGRGAASRASAAGQRMAAPFRAGWNGAAADGGAASGQGGAGEAAASAATAQKQEQPAWAKRLHRRQQLTHAATTTAHTLRAGDGGGSGQGPSLRDSDS
ncbi:P-type conjugative transfer protein TrbL [Pseudomonas aeruginosa]|uniref:P-type conjugative transfer protein TrbL n=1 Tax=Pseudomonas aeruginosa TaxID=287 RepID=UPI000FF83B68|nr:P-type conjugative transfer protein TrbL [Pseudomonas aeruginosa]RQD45368.1 P-type conjugative transfer protein TrbL [Pseudomonas aeruginosa]